MENTTLYLLRHGQTEWNLIGRYQGQNNSNLTALGRDQARLQRALLRQVFEHHPDAAVYASPLGRVRETAAIALDGFGREPVIDPRLQEISAGEWEGKTRPEIEAGWPDLAPPGRTGIELFMTAPGGEGQAGLFGRCASFLRDIEGPCVIFTHGVTMAVLRSIALDLTYQQFAALDHQQGCLYRIEDGYEQILK